MKSNFPTATTIPALICNQLNFFGSSLFPGGKHLQNLKNPYFSCMFEALYFLNNRRCQKSYDDNLLSFPNIIHQNKNGGYVGSMH